MRLNDLFKMVYNLIMFQVRKKPFECLSQGTKQPGRTNAFTLEIAVGFFNVENSLFSKIFPRFLLCLFQFAATHIYDCLQTTDCTLGS